MSFVDKESRGCVSSSKYVDHNCVPPANFSFWMGKAFQKSVCKYSLRLRHPMSCIAVNCQVQVMIMIRFQCLEQQESSCCDNTPQSHELGLWRTLSKRTVVCNTETSLDRLRSDKLAGHRPMQTEHDVKPATGQVTDYESRWPLFRQSL